jgi:hypothetical protein
VAFLGEFGTGSLGNDASPLAAVAELRAHDPDVEARFHRDGNLNSVTSPCGLVDRSRIPSDVAHGDERTR